MKGGAWSVRAVQKAGITFFLSRFLGTTTGPLRKQPHSKVPGCGLTRTRLRAAPFGPLLDELRIIALQKTPDSVDFNVDHPAIDLAGRYDHVGNRCEVPRCNVHAGAVRHRNRGRAATPPVLFRKRKRTLAVAPLTFEHSTAGPGRQRGSRRVLHAGADVDGRQRRKRCRRGRLSEHGSEGNGAKTVLYGLNPPWLENIIIPRGSQKESPRGPKMVLAHLESRVGFRRLRR